MNKIMFLLALFLPFLAEAGTFNTGHGNVNSADYTTISNGTRVLSATADQVQIFSGSGTDFHILQLADATQLPNDWWLKVVNNSSGFITVRSSTGADIASVNSSRIGDFYLQSNAVAAGTWKYNTPAAVADIVTAHSGLTGLLADDHTQYHTDARGDARYFKKTEHLNISAGAADSGKPIVLNSTGLVDSTMLPPAGNAWSLTGNPGLTALQFLGSTDNLDVVFKRNSQEQIRLSPGSTDFQGHITATGNVTALNLSGTNTGDVTLGTANGLSLVGQALSLQAATDSVPGALTAADHATFGAKIGAITVASANGFAGSVSAGTSPAITLSTTITGILKGNGTAISAAASGTDYELPLTFTAPLSRTTNTISCVVATGSVAGCLSAADWTTFNGKQASISTSTAVTNQFVTGFTSPNTFTRAQPAFTDISGTAAAAQIPSPSNSTISASDIDWSLLKNTGGLYTKTLGANTTFTFSNRLSGQTIVVRLTNTASNYTVTWPTVKWCAGSSPTMTVGAKSDVYTFIYDGTDVFGCYTQNH